MPFFFNADGPDADGVGDGPDNRITVTTTRTVEEQSIGDGFAHVPLPDQLNMVEDVVAERLEEITKMLRANGGVAETTLSKISLARDKLNYLPNSDGPSDLDPDNESHIRGVL